MTTLLLVPALHALMLLMEWLEQRFAHRMVADEVAVAVTTAASAEELEEMIARSGAPLFVSSVRWPPDSSASTIRLTPRDGSPYGDGKRACGGSGARRAGRAADGDHRRPARRTRPGHRGGAARAARRRCRRRTGTSRDRHRRRAVHRRALAVLDPRHHRRRSLARWDGDRAGGDGRRTPG